MLTVLLALVSSSFAAPAPKVAICHYDGTGAYNVISVGAPAVAAHLSNHGDAYPGAFFPDADGDGYGDTFGASIPCPMPGYTADAGDCDDTNPAANPGEEEVCGDEIDNNCDLQIDEDCEASCPCSGEPLWDLVITQGVLPDWGVCIEYPGENITSMFVMNDGSVFGIIGEVTSAGFCGVEVFQPSSEALFMPTTLEEAAACESEVMAWLDANGAVCES